MSTHSNLDGVLVQWGERLFYPANRIVRARTPRLTEAGIQQRAQAIRQRIHATVVRRAPHVMVKVTGGGRGMGRLRRTCATSARAAGSPWRTTGVSSAKARRRCSIWLISGAWGARVSAGRCLQRTGRQRVFGGPDAQWPWPARRHGPPRHRVLRPRAGRRRHHRPCPLRSAPRVFRVGHNKLDGRLPRERGQGAGRSAHSLLELGRVATLRRCATRYRVASAFAARSGSETSIQSRSFSSAWKASSPMSPLSRMASSDWRAARRALPYSPS